ncbi:MAG TPA: carboxypeptidase-like regulatory domain-containing protein [Polyangiaceae bacterium]|nr:carboxypeptidase-like regulatory domain-containing protein [Polyangiaceae bacterium]
MMRNTFLFVLALSGCGDVESEPPVTPASTVSWTDCVRDRATGAYLPGVVASVLDRPEIPSVVSAHDGCYTLTGLPPNEALVLAWELDGYVRRLRTVRSGAGDLDFTPRGENLQPIAELERIAAERGVTLDPTRGVVTFWLRDADAEASFDDAGIYLPNVTITPDQTLAPNEQCYPPPMGGMPCGTESDNDGWALMWNVAPPLVEMTVGPEDLECFTDMPNTDWEFAWPVEGKANTFFAAVRPGSVTDGRAYCRR